MFGNNPLKITINLFGPKNGTRLTAHAI